MAVRRHKPTSPAQRQMSTADFSVLTKKAPEKSLLAENSKTGGRNSYGRITVRHIGGGNRRKYRIIDFRRRKDDVPATVTAQEAPAPRTEVPWGNSTQAFARPRRF